MTFPFDNTWARLPEAFFRRVDPTPVRAPRLLQLNDDLAEQLRTDPEWLASDDGVAVLAGNRRADGAEPLAMVYAGHQFGSFVPQLGDGRAILLGEITDTAGVRRDVQLKGSGPTPFSRQGDGRSALGPVLREYLVSEAMAALGVPTTRSLAALATGEPVMREGPIPGGILVRVARSHIRVGTFEWFAARRDHENLKILADYTIRRLDPEAARSDRPYHALLEGVVRRQAELIAHWMQFGFIHGVMNTDNMAISGETIDYGPCAFMDGWHPEKVFSSIDHSGRYAFARQGSIGLWNLTRFAETLLPLLHESEERAIAEATEILESYPEQHTSALRRRLTAKIGLTPSESSWELVQQLLQIMADDQADFTLTFRHLPAALDSEQDSDADVLPFMRLFDSQDRIEQWLVRWRQQHADTDRSQAQDRMRRHNPVFIPRNHRIEQVIQAAYAGDLTPFRKLHGVLQRPYEQQPDCSEYEQAPQPHEIVRATFCGT